MYSKVDGGKIRESRQQHFDHDELIIEQWAAQHAASKRTKIANKQKTLTCASRDTIIHPFKNEKSQEQEDFPPYVCNAIAENTPYFFL